MRPLTGGVATGPTPAERARSVLHAAPVLEVTVDGARVVAADHGTDRVGCPLLIVDDESPLAGAIAAATGPVRASVHAARLRPLRVADRVRGRLELRGNLDVVPAAERCLVLLQLARQGRASACALPAGSSLLRLEPDAVTVDGVGVELCGYRCAAPDPLVDVEARLLTELLAQRPHDLGELCSMIDPMLLVDVLEIAPSGLDRFGVTLRLAGRDHVRETRLPFPAPVDGPRAVPGAVALLLGQARERSRPAPS